MWLQEAEGPAPARHSHSPEQNLEEYSHSTLAAFALLHRLTLVGAPRTVANAEFYSVLACNTLTVDGEVSPLKHGQHAPCVIQACPCRCVSGCVRGSACYRACACNLQSTVTLLR